MLATRLFFPVFVTVATVTSFSSTPPPLSLIPHKKCTSSTEVAWRFPFRRSKKFAPPSDQSPAFVVGNSEGKDDDNLGNYPDDVNAAIAVPEVLDDDKL